MRALPAMLVAMALVSLPAAAQQDPGPGAEMFYAGPEGKLFLEPGTEVRTPVSEYYVAATRNTATFRHVLQDDAMVVPASFKLWIEVTSPTPMFPVGVTDVELCALEIIVGVMDQSYYYNCLGSLVFGTPVALPGIYEITVNWRDGLEPIPAKAGDTLFLGVWTTSSSIAANSMLLLHDAEHPSGMAVRGTRERIEPPVVAEAEPASGSNSTQEPAEPPSGGGSQSPPQAPPAEPAPEQQDPALTDQPAAVTAPADKGSPGLPAGLALGALAALALSLRRRL